MPLGGLLPYGPGEIEDDMDLPVVLDSGDLTDRPYQGADEESLENDDNGILALLKKLSQQRGQMLPGAMPGAMPGMNPLPEQNGQVQNRMPQGGGMPRGGGLGRALLGGFRG